MTDPGGSTSTRPPEDIGPTGGTRDCALFSISLLGALVLTGLLGFLGVRSTTATASANGFTIDVTHASVTRPGLATPLELRITTDDGSSLPAAVTTRIGSSYLAMFDENGLDPQPVLVPVGGAALGRPFWLGDGPLIRDGRLIRFDSGWIGYS